MNKMRNIRKFGKASQGLLTPETRRGTHTKRRHAEPRHLSWQWLATSGRPAEGGSDCPTLCSTKICKKPGFFPRLKKTWRAKEKTACLPGPKKAMSWKEYFSFLLPDPAKKPPLITCRRLQAERRRSCEDPYQYPGYCLNETCCPPPKEWFGQAIVYRVPNPFPEPKPVEGLRPCPSSDLPVLRDPCTQPRRRICLEDYAYKPAYMDTVPVCETSRPPTAIVCRFPCSRQEPSRHDKRWTCDNMPGLREERRDPGGSSGHVRDLPTVVCLSCEQPSEGQIHKEIDVEIKKGTCQRTTFLKPDRNAPKYPGTECCREYHTFKRTYTTPSQTEQRTTLTEDNKDKMQWLSRNMIDRSDHIQPVHSFQNYDPSSIFRNPFSQSADSLRAYSSEYSSTYPNEIDPELLKLAEETNKIVHSKDDKKGVNEEKMTLLKLLSEEAKQKAVEKGKERGEEINLHPINTRTPNKFSLCRTKSSHFTKRNSFSTSAIELGKKPSHGKERDRRKKNQICSGCSGVRAAEEETRNPRPKPFLDCRERPAGKCKVIADFKPGDKEPDNPVWKSKARPYSLCNKPRIPECKPERGYKLPCEENQKKKFHSSAFCLDVTKVEFKPLAEILGSKGIKKKNYTQEKTNPWDSHTADSYVETDNAIGERFTKMPQNDETQTNVIHPSMTNIPLPNFAKRDNDFDSSFKIPTRLRPKETLDESENQAENVIAKLGKALDQKETTEVKPQIRPSAPINIWETQPNENDQVKSEEESKDHVEIPAGNPPPQPKTSVFTRNMKPVGAGNSIPKPTKFSMLFKSQPNEGKKQIKSDNFSVKKSPPTRGQKDTFNPMEE